MQPEDTQFGGGQARTASQAARSGSAREIIVARKCGTARPNAGNPAPRLPACTQKQGWARQGLVTCRLSAPGLMGSGDHDHVHHGHRFVDLTRTGSQSSGV